MIWNLSSARQWHPPALPWCAVTYHQRLRWTVTDRRQIGVESSLSSSSANGSFNDGEANHAIYHDTLAAKTLFIGDLSVNTTVEGLTKHFAKHGSVNYVLLPKNENTSKSQGFGYIEFSTADEASAAFEAEQGEPVDGSPCFLDYVGSLWHEDNVAA